MLHPDTTQTDTMTKLPYTHEGSIFADNIRTPCVDFPWDEVAARLDNEIAPQDYEAAGALIARLLTWVLDAPGTQARQVRFAAMASGLRPSEFGTLDQLAKELGCTRAALSRASKLFERTHGTQFCRSKSKTACARMARRRRGGKNYHVAAGQAQKA